MTGICDDSKKCNINSYCLQKINYVFVYVGNDIKVTGSLQRFTKRVNLELSVIVFCIVHMYIFVT